MSKGRNIGDVGMGDPTLAQFFTPLPVAEFIWKVVGILGGCRLKNHARVIDPAAGTGVFLEAISREGKIPPHQIFGIEIDPSLRRFKAQFPPGTPFYEGDGLLGEFPGVEPEGFDAVVGNPPFGRLGDIAPQVVEESGWERFAIWHSGRVPEGQEKRIRKLEGCPIELLFLERALDLVKRGGLVAFILPDGFFANLRLQPARDRVREWAQVLGVVALPEEVFRRPGLNARVTVAFLRRRKEGERGGTALLMRPARGLKNGLTRYMEDVLQIFAGKKHIRQKEGIDGLRISEGRLTGSRWDVGFWQGRELVRSLGRRFSMAPLGDFIRHLTYGPIITGGRPRPVEEGIRVSRQGDFAETGLRGEGILRVEAGSVYDPPRSRVQRGDLLLPRSGAGALGRNRMAVYTAEEPANIGCFVDLIRLGEINPYYAWFFFKAGPGWRQIQELINGVGTPNINFAEIRGLHIALPPLQDQMHIERRYLREILPLHGREGENDALQREGERRFRSIVEDLEAFLDGDRESTAACL